MFGTIVARPQVIDKWGVGNIGKGFAQGLLLGWQQKQKKLEEEKKKKAIEQLSKLKPEERIQQPEFYLNTPQTFQKLTEQQITANQPEYQPVKFGSFLFNYNKKTGEATPIFKTPFMKTEKVDLGDRVGFIGITPTGQTVRLGEMKKNLPKFMKTLTVDTGDKNVLIGIDRQGNAQYIGSVSRGLTPYQKESLAISKEKLGMEKQKEKLNVYTKAFDKTSGEIKNILKRYGQADNVILDMTIMQDPDKMAYLQDVIAKIPNTRDRKRLYSLYDRLRNISDKIYKTSGVTTPKKTLKQKMNEYSFSDLDKSINNKIDIYIEKKKKK